jgi:hypothetical protein
MQVLKNYKFKMRDGLPVIPRNFHSAIFQHTYNSLLSMYTKIVREKDGYAIYMDTHLGHDMNGWEFVKLSALKDKISYYLKEDVLIELKLK